MNNYIYVGKIVNTFGIKSEVKILSDFEYKDKIFKKDFNIYIGENYQKEVVNTYRRHKNFDLVTFVGYTNINEILKYKGQNIYIIKEDLQLNDDEYLLSDLIGLEVYDNDKLLGVVIDYLENSNNILLKVKGEKSFYLPKIPEYIEKISIKDKKIMTRGGSKLIL